ncbi:MAG TPA: helix-turn-helix transcriptional regulator [Paludibacteraceae bacterium]|nr:helix-turn-helix transcriptional regulator [Paludibacteraceae bacterium]
MALKNTFGENLKRFRKKVGFTQEKFAEKLDVSVPHLSNIELGDKFVSAELIEKIVDVLGISPSALFFSVDEVKSVKDDNLQSQIEAIILEATKAFNKRVRKGIYDIPK